MKQIVKILAVALVMVLSTQNSVAQSLSQDQERPETIAKAQTEKLTEALNLDGTQSRAVFRALVSKEVSYKKQLAGKDIKEPTVAASKKKIDEDLSGSMKKILNDEQYKKWLALKN
ncbi:MAG: hypothetical protein CMC08_06655 [Flavobacteriaceae bacterium]|nr:hypothetical protein [Flavobacteriaceae bacterium]